MNLRRVVEHVKAQHWTAVAIDFVIVVAGVFMGLQVQEWNSARGHRAAEIGYLNSMEEDVAYSIGSLERMIVVMEKQQVARAALYEYSTNPRATLAPGVRDQLVMVGLFYLAQLDIRQVTFEALKSSGQLSAIRSPALVSRLQSLSSDVASALSLQADENQVTYLFSDPILVANLDMGGIFRQPRSDGKRLIPWLKDDPRPAPTPAVMKTIPFGNAVLYRSFFTEERSRSAHQILDQHRRIAELIDARQAVLGVAHD
ncbi:MAG: hypothetical protein RL261_1941 [Pseudomonadota bacterium]|jgi:hypothetical protein